MTPQEPQEVWVRRARKDLEGIRDIPDPVPSWPIGVEEKQGSKWKQQLTLNTEVGLGQGKGYVLVPFCCYNKLPQT